MSARQDGWSRLEAALDDRAGQMTPAERAIAGHLRENRLTIPYETGATIAEAAGVSEMTVIRFVRGLGYANLKDLKDDLRPRTDDDARAIDDVMERFRSRRDDHAHLRHSLALELDAVARAYQEATTARWSRIVRQLSDCERIHVVGFQATQGVALDFASRLKYVRPGVRYAEARAGIYSEILESDPATSRLVIVDTASYARKGILLARLAREIGLPVVIVTDRYSNWALEFTEDVLTGHTQVGTFWDSTASLSVILNLLINSIATHLGDGATDRFARLAEWGGYFGEFDTTASRTAELRRERKG